MLNAVWMVFKRGVSDVWSRLVSGNGASTEIIQAQSGMIRFLTTGLLVIAGLLVLGVFRRRP